MVFPRDKREMHLRADCAVPEIVRRAFEKSGAPQAQGSGQI
jgi:hypothetical protein